MFFLKHQEQKTNVGITLEGADIIYKVHKKEIPSYKAGKFPRFRRKHIDMWLSNPYHPDLDNYNLKHKERR